MTIVAPLIAGHRFFDTECDALLVGDFNINIGVSARYLFSLLHTIRP